MTKVANILFPADYFDKKKPDQSLRAEYEAAVHEDRFDVLLFDIEAFEESGRVRLDRDPVVAGLPLVYRGWMMRPLEYEEFLRGLPHELFKPLTMASQYAELHMFPLAYGRHERLRAVTPGLLAFPTGRIKADAVNAAFRRFMVKDYVKSAKQTSFPAFVDTPITQEEADALSERFVELRGTLYTCGIVCKEYVGLAEYGGFTNEWRAFYVCGRLLNICRNSNQHASCPAPPDELVDGLAGLDSPYYTVDFAEKSDGGWVVIETGDGQVSGLAAAQDPVLYYMALADALESRLPSWPSYYDTHPSSHKEGVAAEDALAYVLNGGDFAHVQYLDAKMRAILDDADFELWHAKKVEFLQGCDDRYVLGFTLAESRSYIVHGEFETAWLTFKDAARNDVVIGDFYGDPRGAAISPDESTCVVYGCGAIIYNLVEPFEEYEYDTVTSQWLEFGRGLGEEVRITRARYIDAGAVELTTEDGETVVVDTASV